jgi:hypothetical protein
MAGEAMQEKSNDSAKVLYVVSYNEEHNPSLTSTQACRDAWCNGTLFFRTLGLSLVFSNTDKCNVHLFCSSRSPSTSASDA